MRHSILVGLVISAIVLAVALLTGATGANATVVPHSAPSSPATTAQPTVIG